MIRWAFKVLSCLWAITSSPLLANEYDVRQLEGSLSTGSSINEGGQVAGLSVGGASFWPDAGHRISVDTLSTGSTKSSWAYGINDNEVLVGETLTFDGTSYAERAFYWTRQTGQVSLGVFPGIKYSYSYATSVNNSFEIVGGSQADDGQVRAFLWNAINGLIDIGASSPGGFSYALDINEASEVIGQADYGAFFWSKSTGTIKIGGLPGVKNTKGIAFGINDLGSVVGRSLNLHNKSAPFLWDRVSGIVELDLAGDALASFGEARSINNSGLIVGGGRVLSGDYHALIWRDSSGWRDLNDLIDPRLGIVLTQAEDINDKGQIVAQGFRNGISGAFILSPAGISVPEPSTWASLMTGFGILGLILRRRPPQGAGFFPCEAA